MSPTFALKSEYADQPFGGSIAVGDNKETYDVGKAIQEGGGTFEVDDNDATLISHLDQYPALKRVTDKAAEKIQADPPVAVTGEQDSESSGVPSDALSTGQEQQSPSTEEAIQGQSNPAAEYGNHTVSELLEIVDNRGIDLGPGTPSKDKVIATLVADDQKKG